MNWLDIFCFTSVARTQSFSITARELMISQQAVSRHIRTLENELGVPLFLRNYQGIELTKAGTIMLRYFSERDEMMSDFLKSVRPAADHGLLRVAWSQWLGCPAWFRAAIETYTAAHPQVQVLVYDLSAPELRRAVNDGEIDVLLTTKYASSYLPVAWNVTEIAEEPVYILGSTHVDYKRDMLAFYPHLAASAGERDDAGVYLRVQNDYAKLGLQPRHIEVFPDMGSVCLNILVKGGVSFGVGTDTVRDNPDFVLMETERTATVVLCRPHQAAKDCAGAFCELLEQREVAKQ